MSTTTTATRKGSLTKAPPPPPTSASFYSRGPPSPKSSAPPSRNSSTSSARNDSTSSSGRKPSSDGADPPWLAAMKERNASISSQGSNSSSRKGSTIGSLFGRRKSSTAKEPEKSQVITSKFAGTVRNNLKADVRVNASRRHSMPASSAQQKAAREGLPRHATPAQQEARHPHSGPPALGGDGGALTTIVSRVEEEPEVASLASTLKGNGSRVDVVHRPVKEEEEKPSSPARRKSVQEVEFKPVSPKGRRKSVFGGWYKSEEGVWTR